MSDEFDKIKADAINTYTEELKNINDSLDEYHSFKTGEVSVIVCNEKISVILANTLVLKTKLDLDKEKLGDERYREMKDFLGSFEKFLETELSKLEKRVN